MRFQRVKGCYDIVPQSADFWKDPDIWSFIEKTFFQLVEQYGFKEIRTPIFEHVEVFTRSVGSLSDIVSKEMYTFQDKGGRDLALRPELTAPFIRAYIENNLMQLKGQKFYYYGPCFRYDRAQKGRYRQFTQFGAEVVGNKDPMADVEIIDLLNTLLESVGVCNKELLLNSIGTFDTREKYQKALREYFAPHKNQLSEISQKRLEKNPLRILDSKEEQDIQLAAKAPSILDFLSQESQEHFIKIQEGLDQLNIPYVISPKMVRGLDYYENTVFEFSAASDASRQSTIAAGGRYDGLMSALDGPSQPGVGFAMGIERVLLNISEEKKSAFQKNRLDYYIIPLSYPCQLQALNLQKSLHKQNYSTSIHMKNTQLKKGLQTAEALNAKKVLILGEQELAKGIIKEKEMDTQQEREISQKILIQS